MTKNPTDWTEINAPWIEYDDFTNLIEQKVNILDILDKLNIEYTNTYNGEFSHRLRCPFPSHSGGNERTASMFICAEKNSFYCFGCNSGGTIINFVIKLLCMPLYEALKWLYEISGITDINELSDTIVKKERRDPEKTVVFQTFQTGILIRDHVASKKNSLDYNKWKVWADKRFKKLDYYLDALTDNDWEIVNNYYIKIKSFIDRNK